MGTFVSAGWLFLVPTYIRCLYLHVSPGPDPDPDRRAHSGAGGDATPVPQAATPGLQQPIRPGVVLDEERPRVEVLAAVRERDAGVGREPQHEVLEQDGGVGDGDVGVHVEDRPASPCWGPV